MNTGGLEKLVALIAIFLICLTSFGWFVLLVYPFGWQHRMSIFYKFDIGLYRVKFSPGIVGAGVQALAEAAGVPDNVQEVLEKLINVDMDLISLHARLCTIAIIGDRYCYIWERLRMGSMAHVVLLSIGVGVHMMGAAFMYLYWQRKPNRITRKWYRFFLIIAPTIYFLSTLQYAICTWDLPDFPPQSKTSAWGNSMMFSLVFLFFSWIPTILIFTVAKESKEEALIEAQRDLKEATADAAVFSPGIEMRNRAFEGGADWSSQQGADWSSQQGPGSGYAQQAGSAYAPNYAQPQQSPPSWGSVPQGSQFAVNLQAVPPQPAYYDYGQPQSGQQYAPPSGGGNPYGNQSPQGYQQYQYGS